LHVKWSGFGKKLQKFLKVQKESFVSIKSGHPGYVDDDDADDDSCSAKKLRECRQDDEFLRDDWFPADEMCKQKFYVSIRRTNEKKINVRV